MVKAGMDSMEACDEATSALDDGQHRRCVFVLERVLRHFMDCFRERNAMDVEEIYNSRDRIH